MERLSPRGDRLSQRRYANIEMLITGVSSLSLGLTVGNHLIFQRRVKASDFDKRLVNFTYSCKSRAEFPTTWTAEQICHPS